MNAHNLLLTFASLLLVAGTAAAGIIGAEGLGKGPVAAEAADPPTIAEPVPAAPATPAIPAVAEPAPTPPEPVAEPQPAPVAEPAPAPEPGVPAKVAEDILLRVSDAGVRSLHEEWTWSVASDGFASFTVTATIDIQEVVTDVLGCIQAIITDPDGNEVERFSWGNTVGTGGDHRETVTFAVDREALPEDWSVVGGWTFALHVSNVQIDYDLAVDVLY